MNILLIAGAFVAGAIVGIALFVLIVRVIMNETS